MNEHNNQPKPESNINSNAPSDEKSPKSNVVAFLLSFFLGILGAHRFYVGKAGTAVLMIFTLGGLFIWSFIDAIMIIMGKFKDKDGKVLKW